jgi:hypothetical protein
MISPYDQAMQQGYTEDQITEHFSKKDPEFKSKFEKAKSLGLQPKEIFERAHQSYSKMEKKPNQDEVPKINDNGERFDNQTQDKKQEALSFGAHALGAVAALPGNIRDLVYSGGEEAKRLREGLYKTLGIGYDDSFLQNDSIKNFDESIKAPFRFLGDYIPNSEDVNKYIDESFGGYLAPKGERQKLQNQIGEDIVNSMLNRSPKGFIRNFAIPAAANLVKKGAELFGVDPTSQEVVKMLSWIGADMAAISNPRQMLADRFSQTRRLAGVNDMINVNARDLRFLDQLEADMTSGGTRPSTSAALTKINEMRDVMQGGQISARQSLDFYRSINELLSNFGAFNVEGASKASHVRRLNQVQNLNRNMLNRYGMTQNPRFHQSFRENNLAWTALEQSNDVAAMIKKNYTKPIISDITKGIFMASPGKGLAIAGGSAALERATSFMRRLRNPVLRQYYGEVLRHSLQNNTAGMVKSLSAFDKAASQFEKEEDQQ